MLNKFFFRKIMPFMRKCGKRAGQANDDNIIRRMRIACWVTKSTNTHICKTYCFSTASLLTQMCLSVTFVHAQYCLSWFHVYRRNDSLTLLMAVHDFLLFDQCG